jgi:hypothetical protein
VRPPRKIDDALLQRRWQILDVAALAQAVGVRVLVPLRAHGVRREGNREDDENE